MVSFVIDSQLPPGLAKKLKKCGYEAVHVEDLGLAGATDRQVLDVVLAHGAILITKDEDFITRQNIGKSACSVLWVRLGNITNRALWAALEPLLPEIVTAFESGEVIIELN